jgi:hypothetical protein
MAQLHAGHSPAWRRGLAILACVGLSGTLLLPAARGQETLTVHVSLTSASLDQFGVVTVSGTLTCSAPAGEAWVIVDVRQPVGRLRSIYGNVYDYELGTCDVTPQPFEVEVVPVSGKFAPGTAYVTVAAGACTDPVNFEGCSADAQTKSLKLKHAP